MHARFCVLLLAPAHAPSSGGGPCRFACGAICLLPTFLLPPLHTGIRLGRAHIRKAVLRDAGLLRKKLGHGVRDPMQARQQQRHQVVVSGDAGDEGVNSPVQQGKQQQQPWKGG